MDPNNISSNSIDDNLSDESDFSTSSVEMDLKQMAEKFQKLEAKLAKNEESKSCLDQFGGSSMVQVSWQFGEKFGKMENQMALMAKKLNGLKEENHVKGHVLEELKADIAKIKEEFFEKNAALERKIVEKDWQMEKINDEIGKLIEEIGKLGKENEKMKNEFDAKTCEFEEKIAGLNDEKEKLDRELRKIKDQIADKEQLSSLNKRIDELEVRTKFDFIEMKENKWNSADCGQKMKVFEGGRVVMHYGPDAWNSVRAQSPIPKFNSNSKNPSIAYFEVKIVMMPQNLVGIRIGFCTQQLPLEGNYYLGNMQNSIGIWGKGGILMDGSVTKFGNDGGPFKVGEVIGIGILHFPAIFSMKCFATCNGRLLEITELPIKFADLQIFPTISMSRANDSIRANFGSDPWRYNTSQLIDNL